jgi:putative DNA primase/helicase
MAAKVQAQVVTHTELGRQYVAKRFKDTLFSRGYWHKYIDGVWQPTYDALIHKDIWDLLEEYEKAGHVKPTGTIQKSIYGYIKDHLTVEEDKLDARPNLINLRNGVWNLETGTLLPHDSSQLLTSQLPFEYDKAAVSPWWVHYIKTTFVDNIGRTDDSMIRLVQEAVAYSLTTDVSYQIMFWCVGEGENGKGVLFHVLDTMGGDSVTPLDLNTLGRSARYELATLAGKRIALCSESSSTKNLLEDATIKALVAGDKMQVRQIKREPFILEPQVKLWWSMNRLPAVADTSHGMWRRIVMIPFNRIFDEKTRIRDLKERLDRELPGIFNWCLEGYSRLKAEAKFSYCQQAQVLKDDFQFESNTIRLFVSDCCKIDTNGWAQSSKIYELYKTWSKLMGYHLMSSRSFKQEMESLKYMYKSDGDIRKFSGLIIDKDKCAILNLFADPWNPTPPQQNNQSSQQPLPNTYGNP